MSLFRVLIEIVRADIQQPRHLSQLFHIQTNDLPIDRHLPQILGQTDYPCFDHALFDHLVFRLRNINSRPRKSAFAIRGLYFYIICL